ncbi:MAG TPA: YiiD C-terminal domain-containing protein [Solimonas sp.]|nr:YiiD C-terminal domain-containing protein [Solimonas sp.]
MTPEQYTDYLYRSIPLTAALALRVQLLEADRVQVLAPLSANANHHGTAFGGSLATLAILSGWVLVQRALDEAGIEVRLMVQRSECDFLEPGDADLLAESRLPEAEWPRFLQMLQKRGRARITIQTHIRIGAREVVRASGTYAAIAVQRGEA